MRTHLRTKHIDAHKCTSKEQIQTSDISMYSHKAGLKPEAHNCGMVPKTEEELTADESPQDHHRPRGLCRKS